MVKADGEEIVDNFETIRTGWNVDAADIRDTARRKWEGQMRNGVILLVIMFFAKNNQIKRAIFPYPPVKLPISMFFEEGDDGKHALRMNEQLELVVRLKLNFLNVLGQNLCWNRRVRS